jgi:hypothetical protein
MLENSLPFIGEFFGWCKCVFSVGRTRFYGVPLHHINLKSDFVSGQVVVGVRPTVPVEDIFVVIWYRFGR